MIGVTKHKRANEDHMTLGLIFLNQFEVRESAPFHTTLNLS